ncbi:MFS transporter [Pseudactinotalea sp.]|uniref:MFS transporter n=1 Tax=Pseudactinotalea sp. TaxID=1926260 RepID=UPI003B3B12DC
MTHPPRVRLAAACVFAVFVLSGLTFASWASRLPTVRDELGLQPDQMGVILLVGACGSLLSLPVTGRIVAAIGSRLTVTAGAVLAALGLVGAVVGVSQGNAVGVAAGLFAAMMGIGSWDMAMNFAGTVVERSLSRSIMPWFHAGFSFGAVLGAAGGTVASSHHIGLPWHLGVALGFVVVAVLACVRGFLPDVEPPADGEAPVARTSFARTWLEPRTLLIGLIVLSAALTEGAANDWLALAVVDGFEVPNSTGALGFTVFVVAMTIMRFVGTWLLDRFGRLLVLRLCTGFAIVGLAVFGLVPNLPIALAGAVLWGFGAALGFPVGMSAASDDPRHAAARLSVVSTIGYTAFLLGPPLLGLLADHVGYRTALLAVLVPLVASLLALPAAAPRAGAAADAGDQA